LLTTHRLHDEAGGIWKTYAPGAVEYDPTPFLGRHVDARR
jgi:hypothetical protein